MKPQPLYRGLKQQLTDALGQGKWKHGQKIPSEPQLAQRYGVSIGTVRRAVAELEAENILVREQGRGTFVVSHTADYMLNAFFRIGERGGHRELPERTMSRMVRLRADKETADALQLSRRAAVIRVDAVLSLRGRPTILDRMFLPAARFPDLTERVFGRKEGTIYGLFQERYGITVVRTQEFITAVVAPDEAVAVLGVAPGAALLRIERTAYTYEDVPVDWRIRLVDSVDVGYLSSLGRA